MKILLSHRWLSKIFLVFFSCAPCMAATITFVQGTSGAASAAAASAATGSSVGLGDVLVSFSKTYASSLPTVSETNSGTAVCPWRAVAAPQLVASEVAYSVQTCVVSTAGTLTVTATWTGGLGTHTDIALGEYHSSTGWSVGGGNNYIAATISLANTPLTSCTTGTTVIPIPAGFLAVGICGGFNVSQTWTGTVGAYTNRAASSISTTGWYDTIPGALGTQTFTTTINSDIYAGAIIAFAPVGAVAGGKPVSF